MENGEAEPSSHCRSHRRVTYSVSFCDSYITDDIPLLNEQDEECEPDECSAVSEVNETCENDESSEPVLQQSNTIPVSKPNSSGGRYKEMLSSSVPNFGRLYPRSGYGALPSYEAVPVEVANGEAKRLVFCVHGKTFGCCTANGEVLEQAVMDGQGNREIVTDHCHHSRDTGIDHKARRKLIIASVLCVVFMIGETVGGVLANSLAIATDAAHLLTDFASFMISLFSLWVSSRPATKKMSFGWYRAEVIGALTSVLMIWVVTGILVYLAIERIINKDFEINADVMLITSAVGVAVNLVMGCTLHQHGHSHGHSHFNDTELQNSQSDPEVCATEKKKTNINVRAAFIHVLGDFVQSIGVLVAAFIIYFRPDWSIADPICTFIFSVLVLVTTCAILRDTLLVLMEGMPHGIDFNEVQETFLKIDGVVRIHNLRIWALSMDKTAISAHLAIRPGVSTQYVLKQASRCIRARYNFFEMTLQIEEFRDEMERCSQCQDPSD